MALVLVQYRGPPGCQSFDKYLTVPDGASQEVIDAAAELYLLDTIRGGMTLSGGAGNDCKPLDYTINYGPLLE